MPLSGPHRDDGGGRQVVAEYGSDPRAVLAVGQVVDIVDHDPAGALQQHPDEAAEIVLENDSTGAQTEAHQKFMMGEVAKLTAGSNGALDEADYKRTVESLLAGGSDPVISKEPQGAWTHEITDEALK